MHTTAIALGSNLGDRKAHLEEAVRGLQSLGTVVRVSPWIETEPVGFVDQPAFLNGAVLLETELEPLPLLRALLRLELELGRDRSHGIAKGPRVIDLDLLLYEGSILQTEELTLPHPEMQRRRFVLEPLAEIAGDWIHPVEKKTVSQLLHSLSSNAKA